eukprot:scaffold101863_cov21-Tisochrysis_lutea.AAC.3
MDQGYHNPAQSAFPPIGYQDLKTYAFAKKVALTGREQWIMYQIWGKLYRGKSNVAAREAPNKKHTT